MKVQNLLNSGLSIGGHYIPVGHTQEINVPNSVVSGNIPATAEEQLLLNDVRRLVAANALCIVDVTKTRDVVIPVIQPKEEVPKEEVQAPVIEETSKEETPKEETQEPLNEEVPKEEIVVPTPDTPVESKIKVSMKKLRNALLKKKKDG